MAKKKKNEDSLLPTDTTKKQKEGVIETKHGIKALSGFTDEAIKKKFKTISSGSLYLDHALGGGFRKGTLAEIWGWEIVGKSTLCLHIIKEALSKFPDENVLFLDFEHALEEDYAKALGVDLDKITLIQPDYGEQGLDILEDYIRMGKTSVAIVDSVAGIVPKREIEGEKSKPGELATILGRKVNILKSLVRKTETLVVFINQIRVQQIQPFVRLGPMGGNSLKFYSNIRIELKRDSKLITMGDDPIGQIVHAHVVKNKFHKPFRKCDFYIIFGEGISLFDEVFDISLENGEIEKAGTWYKINGENIGQGKVNCIQLLKKDKALFSKLEKKAKEFIFN